MQNETFNSLTDIAKTLYEQDEKIESPIIILVNKKNKLHNIDVPTRAFNQDKHKTMRALGRAIRVSEVEMEETDKLHSICLISEVWMSTGKGEETYQRPSEDPDKTEGVLICMMSKDKELKTEIYPIKLAMGNDGKIKKTINDKYVNDNATQYKAFMLEEFWKAYHSVSV